MNEKYSNDEIELTDVKPQGQDLCQDIGELLCDYLFGALTTATACMVKRHLDYCTSCAKRSDLLEAVNRRLQERPDILRAARAARRLKKESKLLIERNSAVKTGKRDY